jgi:hypothetical protein
MHLICTGALFKKISLWVAEKLRRSRQNYLVLVRWRLLQGCLLSQRKLEQLQAT